MQSEADDTMRQVLGRDGVRTGRGQRARLMQSGERGCRLQYEAMDDYNCTNNMPVLTPQINFRYTPNNTRHIVQTEKYVSHKG